MLSLHDIKQANRQLRQILPRHILNLTGTGQIRDKNEDEQPHVTTVRLLLEQLLDSLIVGGIGGFTSYVSAGEAATLKGFIIAFGLAFLVKMKEYRKIK